MIDRARKNRQEYLEDSQKLVVEMKPEFVEAMESSSAVSRKSLMLSLLL